MIPIKTVNDLINKHALLEKELSSGEIDKNSFAEKSKEYADLNEIIQMLKNGEIKPLVSKTFPMERAVEAINLIGNRGVIGKVVLTNE